MRRSCKRTSRHEIRGLKVRFRFIWFQIHFFSFRLSLFFPFLSVSRSRFSFSFCFFFFFFIFFSFPWRKKKVRKTDSIRSTVYVKSSFDPSLLHGGSCGSIWYFFFSFFIVFQVLFLPFPPFCDVELYDWWFKSQASSLLSFSYLFFLFQLIFFPIFQFPGFLTLFPWCSWRKRNVRRTSAIRSVVLKVSWRCFSLFSFSFSRFYCFLFLVLMRWHCTIDGLKVKVRLSSVFHSSSFPSDWGLFSFSFFRFHGFLSLFL